MIIEGKKVKIHNLLDKNSKIAVTLVVIMLNCMASSLIIALRNVPNEYNLLVFLPLSFCLCSFIFINTITMLLKSISVSLVLSALFARNVILPVIMTFGGYGAYVRADAINQYIPQAVLLLIYEQTAIFAVIYFMSKRSYAMTKMNYSAELKIEEIKFKKAALLKIVLFIMCTLVFISFIKYPQLKYYFTFLFNSRIDNINKQNINFLYMNMSVPGYIYWPITYIMEVLRITLPVLILIKIRMGEKAKMNESTAVFKSIVISFIFVAIMTPTRATSVFLAICFCIMISIFYPKQRKRMNMIILLSILFLGIIGLFISTHINRSDGLTAMEETSKMLQAYLGGVGNIANAISIRPLFSIKIFFADIMSSIAFISFFYKNAISTPIVFNYAIYDSSAYCDQIIPMAGQGYFYFSAVLAPIFSCAITSIAIKCEKKASSENNLLKRFTLVFLCVMFSVSPVIYNLNIVILISSLYILPVYVLSLLIGKGKSVSP